jgi:ketosteroid isomerase-like protein
MKKMFFAGSLVLVALLAGCFLDNSPKATVRKFWTAVEKNDMKALAKVATPDTVQLVVTFGSKLRGHAASMLDKKIETTTEEIDGDTAVVTIIFADGEEQNFDLVKVDGKWKVDLSMGTGK